MTSRSGHSQEEIEARASEYLDDLDAWELESDIMTRMARGGRVPPQRASRWGDWSPEEIQVVLDLIMDMTKGRRGGM